MARKKKYPKLPNGYGSIKKLSGKRRNPYGVYPPSTELIAPGQYAPVKAICYVDDYMKGFAVLTAGHAGTYYPGFERTLNDFDQNRTLNSTKGSGRRRHGIPFSEDELAILWKHKNDPIVEFLLIMCYSGYRIKAYESMEVNLEQKYFRGGVKTNAGKDRIVPIHSGIYALVKHCIKKQGTILDITPNTFRNRMYETLERIGMQRHTPHDARHTFSMLCEKYQVNENDRKRMLGHAFQDITNKVYGHRTVEELRKEIEKIKIPVKNRT